MVMISIFAFDYAGIIFLVAISFVIISNIEDISMTFIIPFLRFWFIAYF